MERATHSEDWDKFISKMLSHVAFKPDHGKIRQEYLEHMEDMFSEYLDCGMSEKEAQLLVIDNMGDPDEIGRGLNSAHNAIVGYLYSLLKWVCVISVICVLIPMIFGWTLQFANTAWQFVRGYRCLDEQAGATVFTVPIGETLAIDSHTIYFDELIYHEGGTYELRCRIKRKPFDRSSIDWGCEVPVWGIYDNEGNRVTSSGQRRYGGFVKACQYTLDNLSPDATKIIIEYDETHLYKPRNYRIEIDLSTIRDE